MSDTGLNSKSRARARTLIRRRDYLTGVVDDGNGNSYDAAEAADLTWVLRELGIEDKR